MLSLYSPIRLDDIMTFDSMSPLGLELITDDNESQELLHRQLHNEINPRVDALLNAGKLTSLFADNYLNPCAAPFNADKTGIFDAGGEILAAIVASQPQSPTSKIKGVYIPAGIYNITTPVDLASILQSGGGFVQGWTLWCDEGAVFINNCGAQPAFSFRFPVTGNSLLDQFLHCRIKIGRVIGHSTWNVPHATECNIYFRYVNASVIDIAYSGFAYNSIIVDESDEPSTAIIGNFVNQIYIRQIEAMHGGVGFLVKGNTRVLQGIGFQSNEVHIGWIEGINDTPSPPHQSSTGVQLGTTVGDTTWGNQFVIGVVQDLSNGVIDYRGGNQINILSSANNQHEFVLPANAIIHGTGAFGMGSVRGTMVGGAGAVVLNGQRYDVVNYCTNWSGGQSPAMTTSPNYTKSNDFDRPVIIYIRGGTVSQITVNSQDTGLTSGTFRLMPGEVIKVVWSVAPSWTWLME